MEHELIRIEFAPEFKVVYIRALILMSMAMFLVGGAIGWAWELIQRARGKWPY